MSVSRTRVEVRDAPRDTGVLARRLGKSFASVTVVATVACVLLLLLLGRVADSVHQMQDDESAIRRGLDLATAIREQYIHAAHTLIAGDASHLDHYGDWVRKVRDGTSALSSVVPARERWRVDRIQVLSHRMDELFRNEMVPAVLAGESRGLVEDHGRLDELASLAAADSDLVARSIEARMAGEHTDATHVTYMAASVAMLAVVVLVTLSILLTRQLSEHQRRLVATERMAAIGQLAAGVAHEINNPIGVIRGYLRMMMTEAERADLRRELEILDEEAATCQRIAEDLVTYARTPELSLELAAQDIRTLVEQAAARFQVSQEAEGCRLRIDVEHADLLIDSVRIRQVVQNLLRNAVQASPKACEIELLGRAGTSEYTIRVLDRGRGVPTELAHRIFEPFTSGRHNGTGLGLAVSSGILRAHGGSIEVGERDGGGTEFVVRLPLTAASLRSAHV